MCQNHNIPLSLSKDGGATGGLISKTGAFKTVVCYEYALSPHFLIFNSSLFYWHKKMPQNCAKLQMDIRLTGSSFHHIMVIVLPINRIIPASFQGTQANGTAYVHLHDNTKMLWCLCSWEFSDQKRGHWQTMRHSLVIFWEQYLKETCNV